MSCRAVDLMLAAIFSNFFQSEHHFRIVECNARAAQKLSSEDSCSSIEVSDSSLARMYTGSYPNGPVRNGDRCDLQGDGVDHSSDRKACATLNDEVDTSCVMSRCGGDRGGESGIEDRGEYTDRVPISALCDKTQGIYLPDSGHGISSLYAGKNENIEITIHSIRLNKRILFKPEKAVVTEESIPILNEVLYFLLEPPKLSVEIQAHTDSRGDRATNLQLSQERADTILNYLVHHGIGPSRVHARGYGKTSPIESNQTSRERAKNRRIEFIRTENSVVKEHTKK